MPTKSALPLRVFATFPPSSSVPADYLGAVRRVARWCEDGGCVGALVYTDNSLLDPWVVAQEVIRETEALSPLVAVQPVYMHPYAVAKLVASLAELHGRKVYLNMVAGGFINDLLAFEDHAEHDARYDRLVEYTTTVQRLLANEGPVTVEGTWYRTKNLRLTPAVDEALRPGYMVSGSSPAGAAAAIALGATAVRYPRPAADIAAEGVPEGDDRGIRIGIIARDDPDEAWRVAEERFPGDERGRLTHQLAMATSDSDWHDQLSRLGEDAAAGRTPYWLHPFENYKTFCPYLVGSFDDVAGVVGEYLELGISTFILDVPREPDDLANASLVFERAAALVRTA